MNFFKPKFWDKKQISIFSITLLPISLIISLLYFIKSFFVKKHHYPIPIICVGNIYLGGTGKTPLCIELFYILKSLNKKIAFIKKKYKSHQDEINLLNEIGPTYVDKKRNKAINKATRDGVNVAILDDGFQDHSVNKNLSIVCFNEKQWIGNGFRIPSGPLREKISALKRANFVIINGEENTNIENKILKENRKIKIFYTDYKAQNINDFKNKKTIAFAGIGNPINFFNLLKKNNINVMEKASFPDHYNYSKADLNNLIIKAKENNAILLTTEKDYLRINDEYKKNINYLKIRVDIKNKNQFIEQIKKIL